MMWKKYIDSIYFQLMLNDLLLKEKKNVESL